MQKREANTEILVISFSCVLAYQKLFFPKNNLLEPRVRISMQLYILREMIIICNICNILYFIS